MALSGGVGGAKLALGLSRILRPEDLTIVANTGDDFEHLGLHVSPDIDTLTYVLAGIDNLQTGWGRRDETWSFMSALGEIGGETWFKLGDRDLAIHVERTRRMRAGDKLSAITADFAANLGIKCRLLPMTDDCVRTCVLSDAGELDFQDYFVRRQAQPAVTGFRFEGADKAMPLPAFLSAIGDPALRAIVICPSNPFISIDPIFSLHGIRAAIAAAPAPVIAVSPIIGGRAVKGPTAKMMQELGKPIDAVSVAAHYSGLIDGIVLDEQDEALVSRIDVPVHVTKTLMQSFDDRERLARSVLQFADSLSASHPQRRVGGGARR